MSQLLQGKTVPIPVSGGEPPDFFWNGIPMNADHTLAVDEEGPISLHHQGLPFTAQGRLAVSSLNPPVRFNSGAMPLDSGGRLSIASFGIVVAVLAANGYTATGSLRLGKIV